MVDSIFKEEIKEEPQNDDLIFDKRIASIARQNSGDAMKFEQFENQVDLRNKQA